MKKSWKKDEGVSPVIATILMVAITVVLAAVLYVMVSQYMNTPPPIPITGSLSYMADKSTPSAGKATLGLTLGSGLNVATADATVTILNGTAIVPTGSGIWVNWTHIVSDATHIQSGDRLTVEAPGKNLGGYEIVVSVKGYSGTISGNIPG